MDPLWPSYGPLRTSYAHCVVSNHAWKIEAVVFKVVEVSSIRSSSGSRKVVTRSGSFCLT